HARNTRHAARAEPQRRPPCTRRLPGLPRHGREGARVRRRSLRRGDDPHGRAQPMGGRARRARRRRTPQRDTEGPASCARGVAGPVDRISWGESQALAYRPAHLGERFGPQWATYWFRLRATVPDGWRGSRVDLLWRSGSEATLWIDGRVAAGLNEHHAEATLA